jgi:hypothetical protein
MSTQVHIFQVRDTRNVGEDIREMLYSEDTKIIEVNAPDFDRVYSMESEDELGLEDVFRIFNIEHPKDYRARSLSVTDVVIINDEAYICAPTGWFRLEFDHMQCGERNQEGA